MDGVSDRPHDAGCKAGGSEMTDRYTVIHPDTLEAMRRAGHVAKLEARIEKLEAALREIANFDLYGDYSNAYEIQPIARKALEGKDAPQEPI